MPKIKKVTIEFVVLLPDYDVASLDGMSLGAIDAETQEGSWIGMSTRKSVEDIAPEKLAAELKAIGNDGTFFDSIDD